jgi:competence protein ComFC
MSILDLVYPKNCLACKKAGSYICDSCLNKVTVAKRICPECGRFSYLGETHKSCQKRLGLDGNFSIWRYEGVLRNSIIALKYKFVSDLAEELAEKSVKRLMIDNFRPRDVMLIPIPLHKKRQQWRGFNQSLELGRIIAKEMNWKFAPNLLIRGIATKPQVGLKREERLKNIKSAFVLNAKYAIQNTTYIIFDDVYTTGTTIKEACKILKKSGAKEVWGLTIAS